MRFVVDATARARCLVQGPDAAAFVHRMSTQHTSDLKDGDARLNVLTTDKGRIVDVVHHVVTGDGVLLLGVRDGGADLVGWLDRYFFTEKLTLVDLAATSSMVIADAATTAALVPGAEGLAPWQARTAGALVAVRTFDVVDHDGAAVAAFVVLNRAPSLPSTPGAPLPAATLSADEWRALSVAAGIPVDEIGDAATPLDLGLHDAIHWAKGCYIGQEVIARLDTYGKQRKRLVGVIADEGSFAAGDAVLVAGSAVGALTSVAAPWSPALPRALALVKGVDVEADGGVAAVVRGRDGEVPVRLQGRRAAQAPHD